MLHSHIPTFEEAAKTVLALDAARFHPDTIWNRRRVLEQYAFPYIGTVPVSELTCKPVVDLLLPILREKPAQARKLKYATGRVVNWAIVSGYRTHPLDVHLLASVLRSQPDPKPLRDRALPYSRVGSALTAVRECSASLSSRLALEFLVLNAAGPGAVCGATWMEMDLEAGVWTVPPERMRSSRARELRVPMSSGALAVLGKARTVGSGAGVVFPNARGAPLSSSALSSVLRTLEIGVTPYSFRTSFCCWCAETGVLHDDADLCLGRSLRGMDNVVCPSDRLVPRRKVMEDWAAYVLPDGFQG